MSSAATRRWRALLAQAEASFAAGARDSAATQRASLAVFVAAAQGCEWARAHRLDEVRDVDGFRARVPISHYEDARPLIERMVAGEPDLLIPGRPAFFMRTSGTTAAAKWVPLRDPPPRVRALESIDNGCEMAWFLRDHPDLSYYSARLQDDVGLWLHIIGPPPAAGLIHSLVGQRYQQLYRRGRVGLFVDPEWLRQLETAQALYVLPRLAVGRDIRGVVGFPDGLAALAQLLDDQRERLVRDVRDGTISVDLSREARAVLPPPSPDPDEARRLERLPRLQPRDLWPRLRVVQTMWSGGLSVYAARLRQAFGAPVRELGLRSSESESVGFPLADEDRTLMLAVHRNFYEFIDEDERLHLAHELSAGTLYRVVLTNACGIYRRETGDMVRVVGWREGAPLITFEGRVDTCDLAGERLSEHHVAAAMSESPSLRDHADSLLLPRDGDSPGYQLLFEADGDPAALAAELERVLVETVVTYRRRRATGWLRPVQARRVAAGSFASLRRRLHDERGASAKLPRLWRREPPPELQGPSTAASSADSL